MTGPQTRFADEIHAEKYRGEGETFREAMQRVAKALADDHIDGHYMQFWEILLDQRFLPAGRVQAAMGSTKTITPYNCYVSGTIEDSFVSGHGCIMDRATEAATTMRMGGGIGYDFSTLRPRGASIKKPGSRSTGPISFMDIFDAVCRCVASAGHRRGAQMGILRVDHPDIEEFIHAKQNRERLTGFNVSVAITDEFMFCLKERKPFPLRFNGEVYREVDPEALWETIMRSTWDWAEPGVLFIDTINRENNLSYCETIAATNPCGEQPLPPYGACLLGSFNLVKYLRNHNGSWEFYWPQLIHDAVHVVRAMDNVVDRALYPLHEQEREAREKRRMGLGITGAANAGEALNMPYGSQAFCDWLSMVLVTVRNACYSASIELAREKGPFPKFDARYLDTPFIKRLPQELQDGIQAHGIRNSHLTSIAPTGTISLTADNVSSGIEPVFQHTLNRLVYRADGSQHAETLEDYGVRVLGVRGRQASEVTPQEHMRVLEACVPYVDSAVSKTCNVPASTPWTAFKDIYLRAWAMGAKGCTTFQVGGKRAGILAEAPPQTQDEPAAACRIDLETGRRECE